MAQSDVQKLASLFLYGMDVSYEEKARLIESATPETLTLAFLEAAPHISQRIEKVDLRLIKKFMDCGADPTRTDKSGKAVIDYFTQDGTRYVNPAYDEYKMEGVETATFIAALFAIATHPKYPTHQKKVWNPAIEKWDTINVRTDLRRKLCNKFGSSLETLPVNPVDPVGTPDSFACMMHVYANLCRVARHYNTNFNEKNWPPKDDRFSCNKDLALQMLKNRPSEWAMQSQILAGYPPKAVDRVWDTIREYGIQTVLPSIRYHVKPEHLETTINDIDGKKLVNTVASEVLCHMGREKTLLNLLEISENWHHHQAAFDIKIRTIPRSGKWHSLLSDTKDNTLHVPNGSKIVDITDEEELWKAGKSASNCIGGKGSGCRRGDYHIFAIYDRTGHTLATMQISLAAEAGKHAVLMPSKPPRWMHFDDISGWGNDEYFDDAACEEVAWFKRGVMSGAIPIQIEHSGEISTPGYSHTLARSNFSELEAIIGFPLRGIHADQGHQIAHDLWARPQHVLIPVEDSSMSNDCPPSSMPFTFSNALQHGFAEYQLGPNIGTYKDIQITPKHLRSVHSVRSLYVRGGYLDIMDSALRIMPRVNPSHLRTPEEVKSVMEEARFQDEVTTIRRDSAAGHLKS